ELPFRGTPRMLLHQVMHDEPRRPRSLNDHIPRDLETICLKLLAKEPGRRYHTAQDLADDVHRYQKGQPIKARPISSPQRDRQLGRVRQLLDLQAPRDNDPDERGFEWHYFRRLVEESQITLAGHTDTVTAVTFSADRRYLASGSIDGSAKLWELGTRRELF